MKVKSFTKDEYDILLMEAENEIVSELEIIMSTHQIVVVEVAEDRFKILKYPKTISCIDGETERLGVIVDRTTLEQFIFLQEI